MKMKKLIATLGLTAALIGIAGQASAAPVSLNGISANNVYDYMSIESYKSNYMTVKNDNAYPVTTSIYTVEDYRGTRTWHLKTFTLQPEEKITISLGSGYNVGTSGLTRYYKVHSIGHTYSGDKDLGTFNTTSTSYGW
jgi:hypothetical protein